MPSPFPLFTRPAPSARAVTSPRRAVRFAVLALLLAAASPVPGGPLRAGEEARSGVRPAQPVRSGQADEAAPESSRQLAGRRIVYSYPGPMPPPALLRAIREGRVAGVVLFGENVTGPTQLRIALAHLRQAQLESGDPRPLLLMTDQEGGKVRRLPGQPEISARRTGQAADAPGAAVQAGTAAGRNLAEAGLNVNLAPVLDVYDRPDNFADRFERSYGQDPLRVGELGGLFISGQQRHRVASTAKHFPGLGSAARDENTDERPVTLHVPLAELRERGEAPYVAAIAAGVELVMASWAVYPALDPALPAGLSPAVIGGELRERLGFRGVTVTDALEAGALAPYGDTGARALASAGAGMDLLLCSVRDVEQGEEAAEALAAALDDGRLDRAAFTEAVRRIDGLRSSLAGAAPGGATAAPSVVPVTGPRGGR
ncbi:glycoside hydrolase family 3 N-terminal domain-containing protein [Kitasatospora sp. NPDC054939]